MHKFHMKCVSSSPPDFFVLESVRVESVISEISLPAYIHNYMCISYESLIYTNT